jgi:hypothetical protein
LYARAKSMATFSAIRKQIETGARTSDLAA